MIIIEFMGGMGNQLYQYALYKKLKSLGKCVKMDISRFSDAEVGRKDKRTLDIDNLKGIEYEICSLKERERYVDDRRTFPARVRRKLFGRKSNIYKENKLFEPEILEKDDIYLSGYFQYYQYFLEILPQIKKEISFPESADKKNIKVEKLIKNTESVSIHIRRGDYLEENNQKIFGQICTKEYYQNAIWKVRQQTEEPHFFIFSDDAEYIKQYVKNIEHVTIVDWNNTKDKNIFDMKLMSMCRYNICANSTFSIWASMLNQNENSLKVRPMQSNNLETSNEVKLKMMEPGWVFLDKY